MPRVGDWYYDDEGNYVQHTEQSLENNPLAAQASSGGQSKGETTKVVIGCSCAVLAAIPIVIFIMIQLYMAAQFPSN